MTTNSVGMFSIGGIASGLDTSSMIEQLMQLEQQPIKRLQTTQSELRSVDSAWGQVNTKLSALRTAVDRISRADRFTDLVAVSSSNTAAASVARGTGSTTGTLTFTPKQLASAHQITGGDFASATEPLGARTFSVTPGSGTPVTVELDADDGLQDLAAKLNAAKGGFTASVVKVDDTTHRLVLASSTAGSGGVLAVDSDLDQFAEPAVRTLRAAQDAIVQVGDDPEFLVTRPSNTITDLVPGASITLKKTGEEVTVSSTRDVDGAVKAVKEYVDALNGAIKTLADLSGYDAELERGGVLQGDTTARQLLGALRSAVTAPLSSPSGGLHSAYQVGLALDRTGAVTLDETALKAALSDDFDAVGRLFGRTATTTEPLASAPIGTTKTEPGTYEVEVTQAAEAARVLTGAVFTPDGPGEPKTFRISSGGKVATVTLDTTGKTATELADAINAALDEAKLSTVRASADADRLALEESRYGSAASFAVEELSGPEEDATVVAGGTVWGLEGTHAGQDAAGRVRRGADDPWTDLAGAGRELTATTGPATGLSFTWTGEPWTGPAEAPPIFEVTSSRGLGGGMSDVLKQAEGSGGSVARARQGITSRIQVYQDRIDGFEQRLLTRESTLRRQFTAMETALAQLNSQGSWLASQIGALNANAPQS